MKPYREVVFKDVSTGKTFLTKSTAEAQSSIEWEGKVYPLIKLDVSSDSHPAYTGKERIATPTARLEAFKKRYGRK